MYSKAYGTANEQSEKDSAKYEPRQHIPAGYYLAGDDTCNKPCGIEAEHTVSQPASTRSAQQKLYASNSQNKAPYNDGYGHLTCKGKEKQTCFHGIFEETHVITVL